MINICYSVVMETCCFHIMGGDGAGEPFKGEDNSMEIILLSTNIITR